MDTKSRAAITAEIAALQQAYNHMQALRFWCKSPDQGYNGSHHLFARLSHLVRKRADSWIHYLSEYEGDLPEMPGMSAEMAQPASLLVAVRMALECLKAERMRMDALTAVAAETKDAVLGEKAENKAAHLITKVKMVRRYIGMLEKAGSDPAAILIVDKKIGKRYSK